MHKKQELITFFCLTSTEQAWTAFLGVHKRTVDLSLPELNLTPTRRRVCFKGYSRKITIKSMSMLQIWEDTSAKMHEKRHHTTFLASLFILEYLIGSSYL